MINSKQITTNIIILIILATLGFSAYAEESVDYYVSPTTSDSTSESIDDGNHVSGFFGRLLAIVKATYKSIITASMVIGLFIAIGGFALVREANKQKMSPRIGVITVFVGITLGSPVACVQMNESSFIGTTEASLDLQDELDGNILSNGE